MAEKCIWDPNKQEGKDCPTHGGGTSEYKNKLKDAEKHQDDSLEDFLEWNGIIGYDSKIAEKAKEGKNELLKYSDEEGLGISYGMADKIISFVNNGKLYKEQDSFDNDYDFDNWEDEEEEEDDDYDEDDEDYYEEEASQFSKKDYDRLEKYCDRFGCDFSIERDKLLRLTREYNDAREAFEEVLDDIVSGNNFGGEITSSKEKSENKFIDLTEGKNVSDSYYKNAKPQEVSIRQLIENNDLDNPDNLNYHRNVWGKEQPDTWKYDNEKDKDEDDVIFATRKNGKLTLENGMHRIKALSNSGYDKVRIFVEDLEDED